MDGQADQLTLSGNFSESTEGIERLRENKNGYFDRNVTTKRIFG